jgi:hypothetical protein
MEETNMKKNINLKDNWEMSGKNFDEFVEVVSELTRITKHRKTSTAEINLLLPGYVNKNVARMQILEHSVLNSFESTMSIEVENDFRLEKDYDKELYDESTTQTGFMLLEHGQPFYISRNALPSIYARASIGGDGMYAPSLARNVFLGHSLYKKGIGECGNGRHEARRTFANPDDQNCTLVYREIKDGSHVYRKIFFVPTEKYSPVPLMVVPEIAERICDDDVMGEPEVKYWFVNHDLVETCIVFPEIAEETADAYKNLPDQVLPGIMLRSSDTGKSCVDVKAVAFIGKSRHYITLETKKRKHTGDVDVDCLVEEANEVILENVRTLPSLLASMTENVIYEAGSGKAAFAKVRLAISKTIRHCGLTKIIGKKREKELKLALIAELNPDRDYTEYDVAAMIMKIGDRISDVPQFMRDQLGEACAKAPFAFKHDDDEEELYLMPEEE